MKDGKPLQLRREMIKGSTNKMPIIICANVGRKLLQHDKHASTKISWWMNAENSFTKVSSNNVIEVTANDDVYISPNGMRPNCCQSCVNRSENTCSDLLVLNM